MKAPVTRAPTGNDTISPVIRLLVRNPLVTVMARAEKLAAASRAKTTDTKGQKPARVCGPGLRMIPGASEMPGDNG